MNDKHDNFNKLTEKAKTVKLTDREKNTIFSVIDPYVRSNPIKKDSDVSKVFPKRFIPIKSPLTVNNIRSFISSWHMHSARSFVGAIILVVVLVGSGTSFAAQGALPGDLLYPILVNLNEGVRSILLSDSARSSYEVERIQTRVEEIKKLVEQNRLSDDLRNKISDQVNTHISTVKKEVESLTKKGDLKSAFVISSKLETSLENSKISIARDLGNKKNISSSERASIKEIISGPLEASVVARENTENQILTLKIDDDNSKMVAEVKLDALKKSIETIDAWLEKYTQDVEKVEDSIDSISLDQVSGIVALVKVADDAGDTTDDIYTLIKRAKELLATGEEKLKNNEYILAFEDFKEGHDIAQVVVAHIELENIDSEEEISQFVSDVVDVEIQPEVVIEKTNVKESVPKGIIGNNMNATNSPNNKLYQSR